MCSCWSPTRSTARRASLRTPPRFSAAGTWVTARRDHHSAGAAGDACRRAGRVPAGDDAVRLARDPGAAGRLPHHDHQDLEPVPVSAEARARRRGVAAAARPHGDAAARRAHDPRPPLLRRARRQEQRAAPHPARLAALGRRWRSASSCCSTRCSCPMARCSTPRSRRSPRSSSRSAISPSTTSISCSSSCRPPSSRSTTPSCSASPPRPSARSSPW